MKTTCTNKKQSRKRLNFLTGISMFCLLLFSLATVNAQESTNTANEKTITVKGNVSDEKGGLPNVNILLEGTKTGTVTDFDGNFKFPNQLKLGDVLLFSYVGYQSQKIVITDEDSVSKIKLKINMLLDDIFIFGKAASKKVFKSNTN